MITAHLSLVDDLVEEERNTILFIVRSENSARSLTNTEQLINCTDHYIQKYNLPFKIVQFRANVEANLHIREHINIFQRAKIVIGPHGKKVIYF
jgi:capsular polysaccharide biosynthesis protein